MAKGSRKLERKQISLDRNHWAFIELLSEKTGIDEATLSRCILQKGISFFKEKLPDIEEKSVEQIILTFAS
ncbi:MAG: hypothetical protein J0H68_09795 [Sphingobacteriia bacterium]|nr:hypothetical protein [Sphingobacteriia bacterium]